MAFDVQRKSTYFVYPSRFSKALNEENAPFQSYWKLKLHLTQYGQMTSLTSWLPSNFLRILCSSLFHVEGSVFRSMMLKAGTPQGSRPSPILFNIFVNHISFDDLAHCQPSQFAVETRGQLSVGSCESNAQPP